jgi:hypothetical protein
MFSEHALRVVVDLQYARVLKSDRRRSRPRRSRAGDRVRRSACGTCSSISASQLSSTPPISERHKSRVAQLPDLDEMPSMNFGTSNCVH